MTLHEAVKRLPQKPPVRINLDRDIWYWSTVLGVSEEALRRLIRRHGNVARDVRKALHREHGLQQTAVSGGR